MQRDEALELEMSLKVKVHGRKLGLSSVSIHEAKLTGLSRPFAIKEGPAGVVYRAFVALHFVERMTACIAPVNRAFPLYKSAPFRRLYESDGKHGLL
jgi:hypothetical protein